MKHGYLSQYLECLAAKSFSGVEADIFRSKQRGTIVPSPRPIALNHLPFTFHHNNLSRKPTADECIIPFWEGSDGEGFLRKRPLTLAWRTTAQV